MKTNTLLTKILTILGTAFVWFPILFPLILSIPHSLAVQQFQFDYLMPAELFPLVLVGSLLLLWAAWRTHLHRGVIGWGMGLGLAALVLGQVIASATGLASGAIEPDGWQWALVLGMLGGYVLAVIVIGVGGGLILRDLLRSRKNESL
ncbi:MAG TPA: hypothetical protein PK530_06930 [Anaerolineales bacterium]|nr:hypothetical protein [Anaerolineales bacterium]